jgi:uridine kinase
LPLPRLQLAGASPRPIGLEQTSTPRPAPALQGGTASGKTTVCNSIMHRLHDSCAVIIHQDSFYRCLSEAERRDVGNYNFDSPDAFDNAVLMECISQLKVGGPRC